MQLYVVLFLMFFMTNSGYGHILKKRSSFDHAVTVQKIEEMIAAKHLQILSKIDHSKSASVNKVYLPPSVLLIFGNAQLGSVLMADNPVWGLHLPMKVAIYDDNKGKTWIAVPDLKQLAHVDKLTAPSLVKMKLMVNFLRQMLRLK